MQAPNFVREYAARHTNPWNRACHVVGVPFAPIAFPFLLIGGWYLYAGIAFVFGYTMQWIGHRIEGNSILDSLEVELARTLVNKLSFGRVRF